LPLRLLPRPTAGTVRQAVQYGVLAALLVVLATLAVRGAGSLLRRPRLAPAAPVPPAPPSEPAAGRPARPGDDRATPPGRPRRRPWGQGEIMAGLLAAWRTALEQDRQLTARLLRELAQDDSRIPTWSVVDRAARRAGATGGEWLSQAGAQVAGESPHLRVVPTDGAAEDAPPAATGDASAPGGLEGRARTAPH
jgi:hypothetical protein